MEDITQLTQIVADLTLTAVLFYAWTIERRDHARTRRHLAQVHAKHKQDLREKAHEPTE